MKILINDNLTVTASALEKYILAADLSAEVNAVPAQAMLAAVRDEKPDIVLRYDENPGSKEVPEFFCGVKAHNPAICCVLVTGSKNLQNISDEWSGLADEIIGYPFVTQELMMRLQRMFGSILPTGSTGAITTGIETDAQLTEPEEAFNPAAPESGIAEPPESFQPAAPQDAEQPPAAFPFVVPVQEESALQEADKPAAGEPDSTAQCAGGEPIAPLPFSALNISPDEITAVLPQNITGTQVEGVADMDTPDTVLLPETRFSDLHEKSAEEPQAAEITEKKKGNLKKAAAAVSRAVVAVMILFIAALAVLILTSKMNDGTPTVFGYQFYNVLTGSMEGPFKDSFDAGSLILVKPVKPEDIKTNDVITFDRKSSDSKLTTHRVKVVNVGSDGSLSFTTKGDANPLPDSVPVPANIVKGKVIWHAAGVGNVIRFAQTDIGMIFTVFIPAGAIVIYEIYIFYLEHAERKKKKKEAGAAKKDNNT